MASDQFSSNTVLPFRNLGAHVRLPYLKKLAGDSPSGSHYLEAFSLVQSGSSTIAAVHKTQTNTEGQRQIEPLGHR